MNLSGTVEYLRTILRYLNLSFSILCCFLLPLPQSQSSDNLRTICIISNQMKEIMKKYFDRTYSSLYITVNICIIYFCLCLGILT